MLRGGSVASPVSHIRRTYRYFVQPAVTAFPQISFAGVDIAITETGPVVIELNVEPDPTSAIIFDRSHRELFQFFSSTPPTEKQV